MEDDDETHDSRLGDFDAHRLIEPPPPTGRPVDDHQLGNSRLDTHGSSSGVPPFTLSSLRYSLPISIFSALTGLGAAGLVGIGGLALASELSTNPCEGADWCFGISLGFLAMSAIALGIGSWVGVRAFLTMRDICLYRWVPADHAGVVRYWLGAVTAGWFFGGVALLLAVAALVG